MLPRFLSPGPLFALEMITSVRRARYFVVRVLYAAVLLFALFIVYQSYATTISYAGSEIAAVARFAWSFFCGFSMLQILAVVITGPAMAAGTIASEREHRTIEYLFTTTLSNREIILGKLLSRLMHVGYLILAGMPILFIVMLMGGIAPQAIVISMIVTLSTALTVSIISITVSVWTPRARDAVVRAYLAIIVLLVLPPLMLALGFSWAYAYIAPFNEQLLAANPFYVLGSLLSTASSSNTAVAWDVLSLFVRNQAIVCVLGITASTLMVRRVHLAAGGKTPKKRRKMRFSFFRPTIGDRPMLWKEIIAEPAASRLGIVGRICMMLILIGILTPTVYVFYDSMTSTSYSKYMQPGQSYLIYTLYMGTMICCGGLLLIAARAAGSITSEKERDCWVSLLSTPLEPSEIIFDKIIGNLWAARGIYIVLAIVWGLGLIVDPGFGRAVVFMAGSYLLFSIFASALGVMFSLWCRTSTRAMAATLATGMFVGGLYWICLTPFFLFAQPSQSSSMTIFSAAGCIPFVLAIPGIVYQSNAPQKELVEVIVTYVIGMVGYIFASGILTSISIRKFDWFTGRISVDTMNLSPQHTLVKHQPAYILPKLTKEPIVAEIVEDG